MEKISQPDTEVNLTPEIPPKREIKRRPPLVLTDERRGRLKALRCLEMSHGSGDQYLHGKALLARVEMLMENTPAEYAALSTDSERISYIRAHESSLFNKEALEEFERSITANQGIMHEAVLTHQEALRLLQEHSEIINDRPIIKGLLDKRIPFTSLRFVLLYDGQEILFLTGEEDAFESRVYFSDSSLSSEELFERFQNIPRGFPRMSCHVVSQSEGVSRVMVLAERIKGTFCQDRDRVASAARKLVEVCGFVPDVHGQNFIETNNGEVIYVDGNGIEYFLEKNLLQPTAEAREATEAAIQR